MECICGEQGRAARLRPGVAAELKDRRIRVNVLTPGQVARAKQEELFDVETKRQFESLIRGERWAAPKRSASVALFLASDDSS